jgi:hypothetical protein
VALTVLRPPAGTIELAVQVVSRLQAGAGFQTRGRLTNSGRQALWLAAPHPVFNLPVHGLAAQASFESARMTGWRYVACSNDEAVATVELSAQDHEALPRFARITDGRLAESVTQALGWAERSARVSRGRYVLGMLRLPALQVQALWLRHAQADGVHDLFVPLAPVPGPLVPGAPLQPARFMRALVALKAGTSAS